MLDNIIHLQTPFGFYLIVLAPLIIATIHQLMSPTFNIKVTLTLIVLCSLPGSYALPAMFYCSLGKYIWVQLALVIPLVTLTSWIISQLPQPTPARLDDPKGVDAIIMEAYHEANRVRNKASNDVPGS